MVRYASSSPMKYMLKRLKKMKQGKRKTKN